MRNVCIIGAGAIGGFIGAKLAAAGRAEVSALARGDTLQALRRHGWRLNMSGGLVQAPARARPLDLLVRWLKARALQSLAPRTAHYAGVLGLPAPRLALSNARTQWGVCTEGGAIRLSWRLVHVEPRLADYVVAHEVAHLVEMNHSRRFWALLARLDPGWREARERLELAAATLPVMKGTR